MKKPKSFVKNAAKIFEVPVLAITHEPFIEMHSNRELLLEGCQGILEYNENNVRLSCGKYSINISGKNLNLNNLSQTNIAVSGFFTGIEFLF